MSHGGKRERAGRKERNTTKILLSPPSELIDELNKKFGSVKERNKEIINAMKKLLK